MGAFFGEPTQVEIYQYDSFSFGASQGHDLEKPTFLFGDLPGLESLKRVMTRTARAKYADIRSRKNQRRKEPKIYYVKKGGRVNGTKLLAETATYPKRFCTALVKLCAGAFRTAGHP